MRAKWVHGSQRALRLDPTRATRCRTTIDCVTITGGGDHLEADLLIARFSSRLSGLSYESQWHSSATALKELVREKRDEALAHEAPHCLRMGFAYWPTQPVCTSSQLGI
jgi:hypothetical protein